MVPGSGTNPESLMQKTIRILRVALPIAFVGFLLLIAVSWNRSRVGTERRQAVPVTSTQRPSDRPQAESVTFEDTQTIGGRVVFRIRAERVVAFASGWNTLEGVHITLYRPTGLTYELECPQAQFNSDTKEADAKGGVRVTSSDGVEIATAEIHYDGNRLTNQIPVQFRIDRWNGKAGGLDLNVQDETLRLLNRLTATMTPAIPVEPPMTISSSEAIFRRMENDVTFTNEVVMTRAADQLTADRAIGRFTRDRKTLVGFDGSGNVVIDMAAKALPGEDVGGRKEIFCERFFTEVGGDGQIRGIRADGDQALAHAILHGPPKRDVVARAFRVGLSNRAVSEIRADFDVVMKEFGEVTREVKTEHVIVSYDPASHRATSALLEGNVRYRDPKTEAWGIRANYDIVNDRIVLTAGEGFTPSVVSEGQTIRAKQIEFSPRAATARASGDVIAHLVSKQGGPSADSTNIFPSGTPVFVNADVLTMRQATSTAVFTGNVRAWQETNTLFAQELQLQGVGQLLTASGNVRTLLYNAGSEQRKVPISSRSDQLIARKNERRVELTGSVAIEDESRTLTAERATIFLDAARKIEKIEAESRVVLLEKSSNRRGTGDKATYLVTRKMAYLNGAPATATDPQGSVSGQQIAFDLNRNRVQVLSPTGQTQGTYKQQ